MMQPAYPTPGRRENHGGYDGDYFDVDLADAEFRTGPFCGRPSLLDEVQKEGHFLGQRTYLRPQRPLARHSAASLKAARSGKKHFPTTSESLRVDLLVREPAPSGGKRLVSRRERSSALLAAALRTEEYDAGDVPADQPIPQKRMDGARSRAADQVSTLLYDVEALARERPVLRKPLRRHLKTANAETRQPTPRKMRSGNRAPANASKVEATGLFVAPKREAQTNDSLPRVRPVSATHEATVDHLSADLVPHRDARERNRQKAQRAPAPPRPPPPPRRRLRGSLVDNLSAALSVAAPPRSLAPRSQKRMTSFGAAQQMSFAIA